MQSKRFACLIAAFLTISLYDQRKEVMPKQAVSAACLLSDTWIPFVWMHDYSLLFLAALHIRRSLLRRKGGIYGFKQYS